MKWTKGQIESNDGMVDCWDSEDGNYIISKNIFDGKDWLFEICVIEPGLDGGEKYIGSSKTLKGAKTIGEEHKKGS